MRNRFVTDGNNIFERLPFAAADGQSMAVDPVDENVPNPPVEQVARAERLAALGYRAFKVEPMMSSPQDVVELARRFRKSLGMAPTLMVDVGYLFNDVATAARAYNLVLHLRFERRAGIKGRLRRRIACHLCR